MVERAGARLLEALDDTLMLDSALSGTADPPADEWSGLDHLEGRTVRVVADGVDRGTVTVARRPDRPSTHRPPTSRSACPTGMWSKPLPPILPDASGIAQGLALRPVGVDLPARRDPRP